MAALASAHGRNQSYLIVFIQSLLGLAVLIIHGQQKRAQILQCRVVSVQVIQQLGGGDARWHLAGER